MQNRYVLSLVLLLAVTSAAMAQTNLSDQINAVNSAVTQQRTDEEAQEAAQQEQYQQQQAAEQRAADQRARSETAARAAAQARQTKIDAARQAREAKDEAYQDQLRDLDLQQKKLELQAQQTAVNRENDMIDQKLKHDAAETDLVQSKADANRNVSQGEKSLMQDTGTAAVKKSSSWFN
jgi:hypothetical protein